MPDTLKFEDFAAAGLSARNSVDNLDQRARETFATVPPKPHTDHPGRRPDFKADAWADPYGASIDDPLVEEILERSAELLDLWRGLAGLAEAVEASSAQTVEDVANDFPAILRQAHLLTRVDLQVALAPLLEDQRNSEVGRGEPGTPFSILLSPPFLRRISSLVEYCPIEELVFLADALDKPAVGHRCRLSHDWLRAFVRRHAAGEVETRRIIGTAYAEGRLGLNEAAHLLGMRRHDAVALLEEHGYARDIDVLSGMESKREVFLAQIRADRRRRDGRPQSDSSLVAREVIATQRIEQVDARPWVSEFE